MLRKIFGAVVLLVSASAFAQVSPATVGGGMSLSAGAEFSDFHPDWGPQRQEGIGVFADLDHLFLHKLGAEGEARWLSWNQWNGEHEAHYLLGPRYRLIRFHGLSFYGKFLMGGGFITYPFKIGSGSYFAYTPGGTAEFRLTRHFLVRGDYEYQFWPAAPGTAFTYPNPSHGLTPNGFSVGVAYKIF